MYLRKNDSGSIWRAKAVAGSTKGDGLVVLSKKQITPKSVQRGLGGGAGGAVLPMDRLVQVSM